MGLLFQLIPKRSVIQLQHSKRKGVENSVKNFVLPSNMMVQYPCTGGGGGLLDGAGGGEYPSGGGGGK